MSAEMTLTTSLMPDYRYRRIQFILFLHLNTDSDHSRVEKHGDLFCWDSATASFAVWGILTIHWKISSTVLGLRGFYHLQRWHRLSRSVCGLSSNNEQLLLLIFTRAGRYPGLSEETYLMLLLFRRGIYSSSGTILLPHSKFWGTNIWPHVQIFFRTFGVQFPTNHNFFRAAPPNN